MHWEKLQGSWHIIAIRLKKYSFLLIMINMKNILILAIESCAIMTILKLIKIFIIKMFCLKILFNTNRNIFTFYYNRIVKFNFFIVILVLKIFSNKFFYRNINKYTLNIRTHKTIYIYFIIAYKPHKMSNLDH